MYSIAILSAVMIARAFDIHVPEWFAPLATLAVIGDFFRRLLRVGPDADLVHA